MKPQYKMKRYLMLATLLGGLLPLQAQHQTSLFDSTSVTMEESGLSHVIHHERIRVDDNTGCRNNTVLKIDYDPLSAYVEFRHVAVYHRTTGKTETLYHNGKGAQVYDYVAPARLIYWTARTGASPWSAMTVRRWASVP